MYFLKVANTLAIAVFPEGCQNPGDSCIPVDVFPEGCQHTGHNCITEGCQNLGDSCLQGWHTTFFWNSRKSKITWNSGKS